MLREMKPEEENAVEIKIKALVGVAKCCKTNQLYGVRIDTTSKWIATWAFPIKPEIAKREGYAANQFPPDLLYSKEYPGCPYCKRFEDLAVISRPQGNKNLRISMTSSGYDDIGKILDILKIKYDEFNRMQFNCDLLFLNCGTSDHIDTDKLRMFVQNGGCVYASDLTDTIIERAFPGYFHFRGHVGEVCKVNALVEDRELREIVGSKIQIEYDMPVWAVLNSAKGTTLLSADAGSRYSRLPMMVKVNYGKGTIFYTCFHNYAQASEKEKALLQLLVLKQIGSNGNCSIEEASADLGIDVEKIKLKFKSNW